MVVVDIPAVKRPSVREAQSESFVDTSLDKIVEVSIHQIPL